jgi:uncharacterized membrane protein
MAKSSNNEEIAPRQTGLHASSEMAIGAAIGMIFGLMLAGAIGVVIGAVLGLVIGAVVEAQRAKRKSIRLDKEPSE